MSRPQVGVGIFIMNETMDKFLMSKRKDCGRVALMGGHLERYEQIGQCAHREALEESNLSIPAEHFKEYPTCFNVIDEKDSYHYITFFAVAKIPQGQAICNTEPHKHEDWEWFGEEEFLQLYKDGAIYYSIIMLFKQCNEDFKTMLQVIRNLFN